MGIYDIHFVLFGSRLTYVWKKYIIFARFTLEVLRRINTFQCERRK